MLDKQRFIEMIDEKSRMLYRIAWSILQTGQDCDDALQECVLKAWAARQTLRDDRMFSTWLTRILINECRNIQRKQSRYDLRPELPCATEEAMPDLDLHHAIDSLPEKLRLPIVLHYIEGNTVNDIARILRLPESTVRNRLYRARKKMKLELEFDKEARQHEA